MLSHTCFACDPRNSHRIVWGDGPWTVSVPARFVGPPGRAHGGVLVGSLTCPALQAAEARGVPNPVVARVTGRLDAPVPLASPLPVMVTEGEAYGVQLHGPSRVLASALVDVISRDTAGAAIQECPAELASDLAEMADLADCSLGVGPTLVEQARARDVAAGVSPLGLECFGCSEGPLALQLRPRVAGRGHAWSRWLLEPGFQEGRDRLAVTMAVAAVDCFTGVVARALEPDPILGLLQQDRAVYTGTQGVFFLRLPPIDVPGGYRMVARYKGLEGRKLRGMAALFDARGRPYVVADSIWIVADLPPEMRRDRRPRAS